MESSEHLRGPWMAVLSDSNGRVYNDPADAPPGTFLDTSIRRRSALPDEEGILPGVLKSVDLIDVDAAWVQVKAMAAGLNAAAGLSSTEPGA